MIYPRFLSSSSYVTNVCSLIDSTVAGTEKFVSQMIESERDRGAYKGMMWNCQQILNKSYTPGDMIEGLLEVKNTLEQDKSSVPLLKRLCGHKSSLEYQKLAVDQCIEVVECIKKKYLDHLSAAASHTN